MPMELLQSPRGRPEASRGALSGVLDVAFTRGFDWFAPVCDFSVCFGILNAKIFSTRHERAGQLEQA